MSTKVNYHHKDRLFCILFGSEQFKANALSLYNALNHSSYTNVNDLQIYTIDNFVYLTMKNDVSFIFNDELFLIEHQSTYNPNMPLRGLDYIARQFRKYTEEHELNPYGTELVRIPTPKFYVFYCGTADAPDRDELRLSSAFMHPGGCIEVVATMININFGHNQELMEQCRPLWEYSKFVQMIRDYAAAGLSKEESIDTAVKDATQQNFFNGLLKTHRAEEISMYLAEEWERNKEWILADLERQYKEHDYEHGFAKGRAEGRAEGFAEGHAALEKKYLTALRIRGFSDADIQSITGTVSQL